VRTAVCEPVYTLPAQGRAPAPVVEYAILEFWRLRRKEENVVTLHDLAFAEGSPGAALRIPEDELRTLVLQSKNYSFRISAAQGPCIGSALCPGGTPRSRLRKDVAMTARVQCRPSRTSCGPNRASSEA
jgi:hypothetical protein